MNTIQQHMQLSKQQRQAHTDKDSKCYGHENLKGKNKGLWSNQKRHAKYSLLDFHQIEDFSSNLIHTCHLCDNNSKAPNGFVCINPEHLYFGTASENTKDIPEDVRKEAASKGGKIGGSIGGKIGGKVPNSEKQKSDASEMMKKRYAEGHHICQKQMTCPVCGLEGKGPNMKRYHFDNCKHK